MALVLGTSASAHEMFLKPDKFVVPASSDQSVRLMNGTFDKSGNSISRDRMQNVSIVANGKTFNPAESAWSDDGAETVSYLKYRAGDAGTYAIGVSTKPKVLTLPAPVVNQFVKVSYQGHHGHDADGNHISAYELRTDKDGRARFVVDKKTTWHVSLIHMQQIDAPDADYESNWATATFSVI